MLSKGDPTLTIQNSSASTVSAKSRTLRDVAITLEEDVAEWARIEAAKRDTRVSKLVGEMLREKRLQSDQYHAAYLLYLRMQDVPLPKRVNDEPARTRREDCYDRAILCR